MWKLVVEEGGCTMLQQPADRSVISLRSTCREFLSSISEQSIIRSFDATLQRMGNLNSEPAKQSSGLVLSV